MQNETLPTLQEAIRQRDAAWWELRKIRELIHADPNESTYDEVVRAQGKVVEKIMSQLGLALGRAKVKPEKAERVLYLVALGIDDEADEPPVFPGEDIIPDPREISVKMPVVEIRPETCVWTKDGKTSCGYSWITLTNMKVCPMCNRTIKIEGARPGPDHAGPQPAPTTGGPDVLDALLEDYKARAEMGLKKYGTRLKAFNGRRALVDALQEAMDLSLYLKQALMEEDALADWEHEEMGSER